MRGALEHPGCQQRLDVTGGDRSVADAAARRLDLDEGLGPQQSARSRAHDLDLGCEFGDPGDHLVGAHRRRRRIPRDVHPGHRDTSATAAASRVMSQRPSRRPLTVAAGPSAQLPRQYTVRNSTSTAAANPRSASVASARAPTA